LARPVYIDGDPTDAQAFNAAFQGMVTGVWRIRVWRHRRDIYEIGMLMS